MAQTEYREWIRDTQRCLVCDPWDLNAARPDPHHLHQIGIGGTRYPEQHDIDNVVPLCRFHHSEYHNSGRYTWCEAYGLTFAGLEEIAEDLWSAWNRLDEKSDEGAD